MNRDEKKATFSPITFTLLGNYLRSWGRVIQVCWVGGWMDRRIGEVRNTCGGILQRRVRLVRYSRRFNVVRKWATAIGSIDQLTSSANGALEHDESKTNQCAKSCLIQYTCSIWWARAGHCGTDAGRVVLTLKANAWFYNQQFVHVSKHYITII